LLHAGREDSRHQDNGLLQLTAQEHTRAVCVVGAAQTLAWGSSYHLPAMLAAPMADEVAVTVATLFAALWALALSWLCSYFARAVRKFARRDASAATAR
jgi:thiosulfate reductase cytochrome b subunit